MEFKALKRYGIAFVMLLAGCNLFNPSGTGDAGDTNAARVASGDELNRQGKYAEAMVVFSEAIKHDSTNSLAYYGYAKASVGRYHISVLSILNDLDSSSNQDSTQKANVNIPLLNHSQDTLMMRLRAAVNVNRVLDILAKRDSLTRFFNYLRDTSSPALARADSLGDTASYQKRKIFMKAYLRTANDFSSQSAANSAGYYQSSQFPLTDFAMPMKRISGDYGIYKLIKGLTGTFDLNGDDSISLSEYTFRKKLTLSGDGGGFSNVKSVNGDMYADTVTKNGFNDAIKNLGTDLGASSAILKQFIPSKSKEDTSKDASSGTTDNLDSVVQSLGSTIVFYQFGDAHDNDADGCIDEEVLDNRDNDADAFVEEDARLNAPGDTIYYNDLVDNDHDGVVGTTNNANESPGNPPPPGVNYNLLGFVKNYVHASATDTSFIKIKKGEANIDLRVQLQKDSLQVKFDASKRLVNPIPLTQAVKDKIATAKTLMGGCWRNYNF